jgi:hypothetical protein
MQWPQILQLMAHVCEQSEGRNALLVLPAVSYHVKAILNRREGLDEDMLGFVVWADDPQVSNRTEETRLLFVRPDEVKQVVLDSFPPQFTGIVGSPDDIPPDERGSDEDPSFGEE